MHQKLRGCTSVGEDVRVRGSVVVHGGGAVKVGNRVYLDAATAPIELHSIAGAEIVLCDDVYVGGGTSIDAVRSICVGARTRVGAYCKIMDSHFHPLTGSNRHERVPGSFATVDEDCVIGSRAIITAGAHLGRGTIVGAGSVVTRRFPPGVTLAGVPASVRRPGDVVIDRAKGSRAMGTEKGGSPARLHEVVEKVYSMATDPMSAAGRLRHAAGVLRAIAVFWGCERGWMVNAQGHVRVIHDGRITLGERAQFLGTLMPMEIFCHKGAEIVIGEQTCFNYGCSIEAYRSVRIGARSIFGGLVRISDSNPKGVAPVVIENDVWLAHGAIVEPGVTIGEGSVVSAGSVVSCDIPPHSLAIGNPAVPMPLGALRRPAGAGT